MSTELKRTPFYDRHGAAGAKLVPFAGYEMPIQYAGILEEHRSVREAAGVFDVSHMGEVWVRGPEALAFVQHLITNDASTLESGQILYTPMCQPDGGTVDDLLVYRLDEGYLLVINAANIAKDVAWIEEHATAFEAVVENASERYWELAVQGPEAESALQALSAADLAPLGYFRSATVEIAGADLLVSRTGYTGEDGFEIYGTDVSAGLRLWDALMERGVAPVGLGARDSLRFEACLPLYGHELATDISPIEAGLGWTVKDKPDDYLGKDVLLGQKTDPPRRLIGLEMADRGVPRQGYVVTLEGERVGTVTSGMKGPSVDAFLALALVDRKLAPETAIAVDVRGQAKRARVVKRPFYRGSVKR